MLSQELESADLSDALALLRYLRHLRHLVDGSVESEPQAVSPLDTRKTLASLVPSVERTLWPNGPTTPRPAVGLVLLDAVVGQTYDVCRRRVVERYAEILKSWVNVMDYSDSYILLAFLAEQGAGLLWDQHWKESDPPPFRGVPFPQVELDQLMTLGVEPAMLVEISKRWTWRNANDWYLEMRNYDPDEHQSIPDEYDSDHY